MTGYTAPPLPDADVWRWTCHLCGYFAESVVEGEMRALRVSHLGTHASPPTKGEAATKCCARCENSGTVCETCGEAPDDCECAEFAEMPCPGRRTSTDRSAP